MVCLSYLATNRNGSLRMRAIVGAALSVALFGVAALVTACGLGGEAPTAMPEPTATVAPTATPAPTPTPTPEATPTPRSGTVFMRYLRAQGLLRSGQYEESIPQFDVVIRLVPDFAEAYHGRGLAYYNEDQIDRALEDFDKAIELKADFADAYRNRGVLYTNRGQMALGVPDLRRALELYEEKDDEERAADVRRLLSGVFP